MIWKSGRGILIRNERDEIIDMKTFGELPPIRTKVLVRIRQDRTVDKQVSVWKTHFESDLIRFHVLCKWNVFEWAIVEPLQEMDNENFEKGHVKLEYDNNEID